MKKLEEMTLEEAREISVAHCAVGACDGCPVFSFAKINNCTDAMRHAWEMLSAQSTKTDSRTELAEKCLLAVCRSSKEVINVSEIIGAVDSLYIWDKSK